MKIQMNGDGDIFADDKGAEWLKANGFDELKIQPLPAMPGNLDDCAPSQLDEETFLPALQEQQARKEQMKKFEAPIYKAVNRAVGRSLEPKDIIQSLLSIAGQIAAKELLEDEPELESGEEAQDRDRLYPYTDELEAWIMGSIDAHLCARGKGVRALAVELDNYLSARAKNEGVAYALTPAFFADGLKAGCKSFFGIECVEGRMARDTQRPEFFAEWQGANEKLEAAE